MRKPVTLFMVLCLSGGQYYAHSQPAIAERELRDAMRRYSKAVESYDTTFIETLFADEMIVTSADGNHRNKQQEISDLLYKAPGFTLEYFLAESTKVLAYEKTGVVTGILRWKVKEQPKPNRRTFTFAFARKKGRWQILAQHIGRVPE